jgi:methylase of polypeptide subunit release factors
MSAGHVITVDLNPLCVKIAERNILVNGRHGVIEVLEGRVESIVEEDADLLLANIHCHTM